MSFSAYEAMAKSQTFIEEIENITGKKIIHTIEEAEPIGYKIHSDIMVIIPCTGNTIGKLLMVIYMTKVM